MFKKKQKNILGEIKYPVGIQLVSCASCEKYDKQEHESLCKELIMSDHIKNKYHNLIEDIIHDFEVGYLMAATPDTGDSIRVDESNKYLKDLKKKFAEIKNYNFKGEKC